MTDFNFNNLRTNGNAKQKQILIETAQAVEQYCEPKAVKKMRERTTAFVFSSNIAENADGEYRKIDGQDIIVLPPVKFSEFPLKTREKVVCH